RTPWSYRVELRRVVECGCRTPWCEQRRPHRNIVAIRDLTIARLLFVPPLRRGQGDFHGIRTLAPLQQSIAACRHTSFKSVTPWPRSRPIVVVTGTEELAWAAGDSPPVLAGVS